MIRPLSPGSHHFRGPTVDDVAARSAAHPRSRRGRLRCERQRRRAPPRPALRLLGVCRQHRPLPSVARKARTETTTAPPLSSERHALSRRQNVASVRGVTALPAGPVPVSDKRRHATKGGGAQTLGARTHDAPQTRSRVSPVANSASLRSEPHASIPVAGRSTRRAVYSKNSWVWGKRPCQPARPGSCCHPLWTAL
jgi:hypothetical protein